MNNNISILQDTPKFCIYRITNKINHKSYIGQHSYYNNPLLDKHGRPYMGSGTVLRKAYKKYGKENFQIEVLIKDVRLKEEINLLEKEYISKEREQKGVQNVYNIADGGTGGKTWQGVSPNLGKKCFNNGKIQILAETCPEGFVPGALTTISEEGRKCLSDTHLGAKNPSFGKKWYHNKEGESKLLTKEDAALDNTWIPGRIAPKRKGYNISEEERKRRSEKRKGQTVPQEIRERISATVRKTCSSEEWRKLQSQRTKEGMRHLEPMKSQGKRYTQIKNLGLLSLLGIYDDMWRKFRHYEKEYGKINIADLIKESLS